MPTYDEGTREWAEAQLAALRNGPPDDYEFEAAEYLDGLDSGKYPPATADQIHYSQEELESAGQWRLFNHSGKRKAPFSDACPQVEPDRQEK